MAFLVADAQESTAVDFYEVELNGEVTRSDPERDEANGLVRLHHDLSALPEGDHTARVRSINKWGASEWTSPLGFTSALPPTPMGLGISDS